MTDLPNIRISVKPAPQNLIFKWRWAVETEHEHGWATTLDSSGFRMLHGDARTPEKARERARKEAAEYCDAMLAIEKRKAYIEKNTTTERVTCEGL